MAKKTIDQVDVAGQRVLMRVDFNVPLDSSGAITDDRRIQRALPSINSVLDRGGKLILMSHLGRPAGTGLEPGLSLKPVAERLETLLKGRDVHFVDETVGDKATAAVNDLKNGAVLLLENLRFHKAEKDGDGDFARALASTADIYCNEAFGTAHRTDASMVGVPHAMTDKPRVAGLLLQEELRYVGGTIKSRHHPFVAVLGGAKVSDKLGALRHLMTTVDTILIGGAMAYTLLKANGVNVGDSKVESNMLSEAEAILDAAAASPTDLILPCDHTCGKQAVSGTAIQVTDGETIESGWIGLDLGPETMMIYGRHLRRAKTIIWNGPMGMFEVKPFHVGSKQVAGAIAEATESGAVSVVGGGDTAAAVDSFDMTTQFSHVSTGGGVTLQMLAGERFESVAALENA